MVRNKFKTVSFVVVAMALVLASCAPAAEIAMTCCSQKNTPIGKSSVARKKKRLRPAGTRVFYTQRAGLGSDPRIRPPRKLRKEQDDPRAGTRSRSKEGLVGKVGCQRLER